MNDIENASIIIFFSPLFNEISGIRWLSKKKCYGKIAIAEREGATSSN